MFFFKGRKKVEFVFSIENLLPIELQPLPRLRCSHSSRRGFALSD
jgi:hypothetical protein